MAPSTEYESYDSVDGATTHDGVSGDCGSVPIFFRSQYTSCLPVHTSSSSLRFLLSSIEELEYLPIHHSCLPSVRGGCNAAWLNDTPFWFWTCSVWNKI